MTRRIRRRILLPRSLDARLKNLAELQQETNGALLYVPQVRSANEIDCRVDALYMTAVGTAGHVRAEPQRMAIVNCFFERNSEYLFVKWHTHCRGTGEHWFTRLSQGDIDSYEAQLQDDSRFIGMMASPLRTLLYGRGELDYSLVEDTSTSRARGEHVSRELQISARELGYRDLPRLRAIR